MFYIPDYINLVRVDEKTAILSSPRENKRLEGTSVDLVFEFFPHLKNGCEVDELVAQTSATQEETQEILQILQGSGVLRSGKRRNYNFLEWASQNPEGSENLINNANIGVISPDINFGYKMMAELGALKIYNGEELSKNNSDHDLLISYTIGVRPQFHYNILQEIFEDRIPWLPVRIVGQEIRFGPLTRPKKGDGCYSCYFNRMIASQENTKAIVEDYQNREDEKNHPPYPDSVLALTEHLAIMQAYSFIGRYLRPTTVGSVIYFDFLRIETHKSDVLKIPNCDTCA